MYRSKIKWDWEISKKTSWLGAGLKEIFFYKDLIIRLVRKDILIQYQQTLLGPFWILLQPILTVFTYVLVFWKVIGIPTEGVPPFLFYLTGITLWNLFSDVFTGVAGAFSRNIHIFSKVYFPRIIAPLSTLVLNGFFFAIHFSLLLSALLYFYIRGDIKLTGGNILACIVAILGTAGVAFGLGLIFSVLTGKYKDLMSLLNLIIRLLMFICPIFYSVNIIPHKIAGLVNLNPLTSLFELFRYGILHKGYFSSGQLLYSISMAIILVLSGLLFFNKKGDQLIDIA